MMKIVDNLPKRNNRSHYTLDRRPKKPYKEKQAVIECYKLNSSPYTIHQLVAYRCVECGKFISKEQFMKCARCEKCNGGKEEC